MLVSSNPEPEAEPSAEAVASPEGEAEVSCHIAACHVTSAILMTGSVLRLQHVPHDPPEALCASRSRPWRRRKLV